MQGIWSSAAVRSFSTYATRRASPRLSPVVMDAAGELAAIPRQLPWAQRASRISIVAQNYCDPLAAHARPLQAADHRHTDEDNALRHRNQQLALALWTLLSEAPRLLGRYEEQTQANEWPRLQPAYVKQYEQESCDTYHELLREGPVGRNIAFIYAAALKPGLWDRLLGEGWLEAASKDAKGEDNLLRRIERCRADSDFDGLSGEEAHALRDYAHSDSGVFNLMRAWDELVRLWPDLDITHSISEIACQIQGAALALYKLPGARVWGNLYKGLQSRPGDDWGVGSRIEITRPYSATVLPEQSYAGRVVNGKAYDAEFLLKAGANQRTRAVMLVPFHPSHTIDQGEALILGGQVYCVKGSEDREMPCREGGSQRVVRHIAEKVADLAQ